MKSIIRIITVIFASAAALFGLLGERAPKSESCLRLHIIANSDSEEDQAVKLKVRDAVLALVREDFSAGSREEAVTELLSRGAEMQETAEQVLRVNGFDYGAQLIEGEFDFPDRVYGDELYPAGRYEALRIVLGDGEGRNWWCVMFPPLCVIETAESPAEFNEDGTLKFRSAVWELLKEVFGL